MSWTQDLLNQLSTIRAQRAGLITLSLDTYGYSLSWVDYADETKPLGLKMLKLAAYRLDLEEARLRVKAAL